MVIISCTLQPIKIYQNFDQGYTLQQNEDIYVLINNSQLKI